MIVKLFFLAVVFLNIPLMAAEWKFQDGENSKFVKESGDPALKGFINDAKLCPWAREDDRDFFLTFLSGSAVTVNHSEALNFKDGFTAIMMFAADLDSIPHGKFANLFTKGNNFTEGYSVMIDRNGTLMLDLKGIQPEYWLAPLHLKSNMEYKLAIYVGNNKIQIFVNDAEVYSRKYSGNLDLSNNRRPLRIGSIGGAYNLVGRIYNFKLLPYTAPVEIKQSEADKLKQNSFKEIPVIDPAGTVIVKNFPDFTPQNVIKVGNGGWTLPAVWNARKVKFMKQSDYMLHPPSSPAAPAIVFNPGLSGKFDVYAGMRAVSVQTEIQIRLTSYKMPFLVKVEGVGKEHRNLEVLLARNVEMSNQSVELSSTGQLAYLGYIKFIPSGSARVNEVFDPAGKAELRSAVTAENVEAKLQADGKKKIQSGFFRQRFFEETRPMATLSNASTQRGFVVFEQPTMELLFKNSNPVQDSGTPSLKVRLSPDEFEPLSIGIKTLQSPKKFTLNVAGKLDDNLSAKISVVKSMMKRSTNFQSSSEVMEAPQYLENTNQLELGSDETGQFWLDVHANKNAHPGKYKTTLKLTSGAEPLDIPLEIEVLPIDLAVPSQYDIGFWVNFGGMSDAEVDKTIKDLVDYNMNSFVMGQCFVINGDNPDNYTIDFAASPITRIVESCKKYKMSGNLHIAVDSLVKGGDSLKRLVMQLEEYAKSNDWPKRVYTSHDEITSHPEQFPKFLQDIKTLKALNLTVMADHIYLKSSRPLQKEIDECTPFIDIFVERFNTGRLFYVDSYPEMEGKIVDSGRRIYAYNSNNAIMLAQTAGMRFASGWFFRSFGKKSTGHFTWAYNWVTGSPYSDLDGDTADWCYMYPPYLQYKGGPALDLVAHREGVDDLRYILTLESAIAEAKAAGKTAEVKSAEELLNNFINSFDYERFYRESPFITSRWTKQYERNGKFYASGVYNLPNGWKLTDYDNARHKIADEIIKLQKISGK